MANASTQAIERQLEGVTISPTEGLRFNPPEIPIPGIDYLPFNPRGNPELSAIPRYLFRAFSVKSLGSTDEAWVKSRDIVAGRETAIKDIFQTRTHQSTAEAIADHLRWIKGERDDNLMSWTSSLLFAIHLVFYRHARRKDESKRDGSAMTDIKICIVDTTMFADRTFIRDMDLINEFKAMHQKLRSVHNLRTRRTDLGTYYFCEYLSQGSLNIGGKCQIISAEAMIEPGLLSLQAEFRKAYQNAECGWADEVLKVRKTFPEECTTTQDPVKIEVAIRIAQLFGPRWRLPVAISLVALLPGRIEFKAVERAFGSQESFTDEESLDSISGRMTVAADVTMPEIARVRRIVDMIYADRRLNEAEASLRQAIISLELLKNNRHAWSAEERRRILDRIETLLALTTEINSIVYNESEDWLLFRGNSVSPRGIFVGSVTPSFEIGGCKDKKTDNEICLGFRDH